MHQDFLDLLRAFIDRNVRFLIVGAYALAVHGRPRATGDLDVWVDATPENAANIMLALEQFGAPTAAFGPVMADVIGREAFIKNKRATGRAKDLGDIEGLGE
ncbi:MAG TPA: hypothetical protein VFV98_18075 [Vicinamibacterales bacterium]|nr:hypothetical protein [Vicinamibacterales bacterium]